MLKIKVSSKLKLVDMKVELGYKEKVLEDNFTLFHDRIVNRSVVNCSISQ